ncbi:hypothetical protein Pint_28076 [Pistacia integerrima]|uniref:Uncharacterized protein n=1 Tax=Pistacia integerrima TaxID=434235 RepID=A0ACC0YWB9_9ROSI|nr:hypothetical protein Pint_28076 [Pistacia integerrima]
MLTAPDEQGHPPYIAKDIVPFYLKHGPKIFPQSLRMFKRMKSLLGPKYNGDYLRKLAESDALLSEVCIATSAAPTYFPTHHFKTKDSHGNDTPFHLVDGGMAANNPTLLAMKPTGTVFPGNPDEVPAQALQYQKDATLTGDTSSTDKATKKNMQELVKIGDRLLKKPVSRMNLDSGILEPVDNGGNNEQVLTIQLIALTEKNTYTSTQNQSQTPICFKTKPPSSTLQQIIMYLS